MEAIIVLALIVAGVVWLVLPFVTLAKISGIAWEIQELKMLAKRTGNPDVKPKLEAKPKVEAKLEIKEEVVAEAARVKVFSPPPHVQPPHVQPPLVPPHVPMSETPRPRPAPEPTALDVFWSRVEDWLAVRGDFAPAGMTREFAIATRWLVRIGTLILVGAIAYFMVLAIDKGWIGPVQRVYGMMFWGAFGIVAGTWIKLKKENYALLGEVAAALGLVALYLSFGLGHRFFKPPVIESYAATFAGLVTATVAAGFLSARLKSLPIAVLGLLGGLLAPMIVQAGMEPIKLDAYLMMLAVGACFVASLRRWTAYGFAAIVAVFVVFLSQDIDHGGAVNGAFMSVLYLLAPTLTLAGACRRSQSGNNFCWAFVAICAFAWTGAMREFCFGSMGPWSVGGTLAVAAVAHAALAALCRCRRWQVGDGVPALICIAVGFAAYSLLAFLGAREQWRLPAFCLFAGILAELHVRSGERTLGALSLLVAVVCIAGGIFVVAPESYRAVVRDGYWQALLIRSVRLWSVPALMTFLGWRLDEDALGFPSLRAICHVGAAAMGFVLATCESYWLGKLFLPVLKGGMVTIVWAVVALGALSAGIVRRRRLARLVGLWLLAAAVVKLLLFDTASLPTPGRVGAFGLVGIVLIACAFLYLRFKARFEDAGTEPRQPEREGAGE